MEYQKGSSGRGFPLLMDNLEDGRQIAAPTFCVVFLQLHFERVFVNILPNFAETGIVTDDTVIK